MEDEPSIEKLAITVEACELPPLPKQQSEPVHLEGSGDAVEGQTHTPNIEFRDSIKVGHVFETLKAAAVWYNDYTKHVWFSTKIYSSKKNSAGEVNWKVFACSKERKTHEAYRQKQNDACERICERKYSETRCGCQARMHVAKIQKSDGWVVRVFEDRHNHALVTPSKVHILRLHKTFSAAKKALIEEYSDASIPMCTQIRLLANEAWGPAMIVFSEKDIYNLTTAMRAKVDGCDMQTLLHYFEVEKEKNEHFFYAYDTDHDDTFSRCFWADSDCRNSYGFFGEAVVFDTTFSTNKYD